MDTSRLQHTFAAVFIFVIAVVVAWISFYQEPADAFLFPRLISVFFAGLAAWNLVRAVAGMAKVGDGMSADTFLKILPGLVIAFVYVFFAARFLGFYLSSWVTFLLLYTLYDPVSPVNVQGWIKRIIVTTCFMVVMYGLFALLLKVQTPRGIWF